jgi:hypothetical protein
MKTWEKITVILLVCCVTFSASGCGSAGSAASATIKVLQKIPWGEWIRLADAVVNLITNIKTWVSGSKTDGKISTQGRDDGDIRGVPMLVRDRESGQAKEVVLKARWNASEGSWEILDQ